MSRYVRNTAVQAKIETTYGTEASGFTATDAVLIAEATYGEVQVNVPRNLLRPYFGASEELQVTGRRTIRLLVEFASSGTAGTAPAWGALLRACGFAQTIIATTAAVFTPISTLQESVTIRYFEDGILHTCVGCRGTASLRMMAFDKPMIEFNLEGLDTVASTATALPATDFTAYKKPLVATFANAVMLSLGATYAAGTGVISGGVNLASRGLEVNLGNAVSHIQLFTGESIDLTNREVTGRTTNFLTAAEEVTWRAAIRANTLAAVGFQLGSAAGSIIGVYGGAVQRTDPAGEDYEGRKMLGTGVRFLPVGTSGNDEIRIIAR